MKISNRFKQLAGASLAILAGLGLQSHAQAHMPWLATDDAGHAVMWFGESPDDRTYHMPEAIAKIAITRDGNDKAIKTAAVDSDEMVGIRSGKKVKANAEISGTVVYGLYHGMKLTYHVEHLPHKKPSAWPTEAREGAGLQTVITPAKDGGVSVAVLRDGKPVKDAEVKLYCEEGHEEGAAKTDAAGVVAFTGSEVESGLNAVLVGLKNADDAGTHNGEAYKSSADYLTATFFVPGKKGEKPQPKKARPSVDASSDVSVVPAKLPDLPEELTSFGAAVVGSKIYVYGGHTGEAHSYSKQEQSNRLWCLDMKEKKWTELGTDKRLQGLALVPWKDRVVRIGGFSAMNETGEEQDLQSQNSVAVFDPATGKWKDMAPLPEPRSSFDAAVLGDKVYVIGGWHMGGDSDESKWHKTAWSLDLSNTDATWEPLSEPPFQRRALSVAAHDGKLYAVGGMKSQGGPSTRVDVYDPATDSWTQGPDLAGSGMSGFGSSSFASGERLYVSTIDGNVYRLDESGKAWTSVAKTDPARFFHRMLPVKGDLLMIGGANMEIGKFTHIDRIVLTK